MLYYAGRIFQIIGLVTLPSSIWVGHFEHSEQGAIAILVGSVLIFFLGYLLVRFNHPSH